MNQTARGITGNWCKPRRSRSLEYRIRRTSRRLVRLERLIESSATTIEKRAASAKYERKWDLLMQLVPWTRDLVNGTGRFKRKGAA